MRKSSTLLLSICALSMSVVSNAYVATVNFNGGDIVANATNNYSTNKLVGDGYIALSSGIIRTYNVDNSSTTADAESFNKWLGGLGDGEGIKSFNLWLQDGHSNQAAMWGETIAFNDAYSDEIYAFAPVGWEAAIVTCPDSWGSYWAGRKMIEFWATDSAYYLKPGTNLNFGFKADITGNDGATGPIYQMWVGSSEVVGHSGEGTFQRAITAEATVPGPAAVLPFVGGLIIAARKRRK